MHEILTPQEMGKADSLAMQLGPFDGYGLMRNAGSAIAALVLERFPGCTQVDVLCGPGNNGGDGYVVARLLTQAGVAVRIWAEGTPRAGGDAALAAADCPITPLALAKFSPAAGTVVIDALYGAGLSKPLSETARRAAGAAAAQGVPVVAVDLPSGVSGQNGKPLGEAFSANLTVTFARKKPGHLLEPGRSLCGEVKVVDIGITDAVIEEIGARAYENLPELWLQEFPIADVDTYKYRRGHVGVFTGGPAATGAARLAAMAAARSGAGAVTVLSPTRSLTVNGAHLTSIMLRKADTMDEVLDFLEMRKPQTLVYGPGLGSEPEVGDFLLDLLGAIDGAPQSMVIDADGITSTALQAESFFAALHRVGAPAVVLTPHEGEFRRMFREISENPDLSKLDRARLAAARANAVVIYKGPDTVIASPDGRAAINSNGTPLLATAGSGDVLGGICAGLLAQAMPAFEAACAAVWLHGAAASHFGPGLIAEDLPEALRPALRDILARRKA